jgi:hypothetical protein
VNSSGMLCGVVVRTSHEVLRSRLVEKWSELLDVAANLIVVVDKNPMSWLQNLPSHSLDISTSPVRTIESLVLDGEFIVIGDDRPVFGDHSFVASVVATHSCAGRTCH